MDLELVESNLLEEELRLIGGDKGYFSFQNPFMGDKVMILSEYSFFWNFNSENHCFKNPIDPVTLNC